MSTKKKRHHYVPEVYTRNFVISDDDPRLYVYEKGAQRRRHKQIPRNVAVQRYYYAFEKHEGGRDTNSLEELFSAFEGAWPSIVDRALSRENFSIGDLAALCNFIAISRVRVPNFRIQFERFLAQEAKRLAVELANTDPDLQNDYERLVEQARRRGDNAAVEALKKAVNAVKNGEVEVSIDPQMSIKAMAIAEDFAGHLLEMNWMIAAHDFDETFVTSDNPVVWYDSTNDHPPVPYQCSLGGRHTEVIFPMTKRLVAIGNRSIPHPFCYSDIKLQEEVSRINEIVSLAAERYVFSDRGNCSDLVKKYENVVPQTDFSQLTLAGGDRLTVGTQGLGPRKELPKWKK